MAFNTHQPLSLKSRRSVFVALNRTHEEFFCRLYSDADLMQHIGPPLSWAKARRAFAAVLRQQEQRHDWAVSDSSGVPFALIGLTIDPLQRDRAEIGIILKASHQHRGLASELVARITLCGFQTLGLATITSHSVEENKAALVFMQKLGFSQVKIKQLPHCDRAGYFWQMQANQTATGTLAVASSKHV